MMSISRESAAVPMSETGKAVVMQDLSNGSLYEVTDPEYKIETGTSTDAIKSPTASATYLEEEL